MYYISNHSRPHLMKSHTSHNYHRLPQPLKWRSSHLPRMCASSSNSQLGPSYKRNYSISVGKAWAIPIRSYILIEPNHREVDKSKSYAVHIIEEALIFFFPTLLVLRLLQAVYHLLPQVYMHGLHLRVCFKTCLSELATNTTLLHTSERHPIQLLANGTPL